MKINFSGLATYYQHQLDKRTKKPQSGEVSDIFSLRAPDGGLYQQGQPRTIDNRFKTNSHLNLQA